MVSSSIFSKDVYNEFTYNSLTIFFLVCKRTFLLLSPPSRTNIENRSIRSCAPTFVNCIQRSLPLLSVYTFLFLFRIWEITGEGSDIGDIASEWISKFLDMEGCRMFFMSPSHCPRFLLNDTRFLDDCGPNEVVSMQSMRIGVVISC